MSNKRICVDFDGVLHSYTSGWKGEDVIPDPPVPGAIEFLRELRRLGYETVILTTRTTFEKNGGIGAIRSWLHKHDYEWWKEIAITDHKLPAWVYIDDRAFRFQGQWPTEQQLIEAATPWNK